MENTNQKDQTVFAAIRSRASERSSVISTATTASATASVTGIAGLISLPDAAPGFWLQAMTPEAAYKYRAVNGVSQCTRFVADMLVEHFGHDVFNMVFPNGVKGANDTFLEWKDNPNLQRLSPDDYSISDIQQLADDGYLVLMAYYYPEIAGHVAFVGHSELKLFTIPAISDLEGKRGTQMHPSYFPVMVQAGTYTGVTSMVYATNGWLRNDNFGSGIVRYYLVKAN